LLPYIASAEKVASVDTAAICTVRIVYVKKELSQAKVVTHMQAYKSKRCPRCGGNIFTDEDTFGHYEQCLQCGYEQQIQKVRKLQTPSTSIAGLHCNRWAVPEGL